MKFLQAPPKISFVIPLYNYLSETREMLASLQASLPPDLQYEIILVDDGSTDGTRDWLQGVRDTRIRIHLNKRNCGYAATNNVGVRLAHGDILGLLNSDLLFEPGWLEPMLEVMSTPQLNADVVGNLQYRVADGSLDHAGVCLTPKAQFDHIRSLPSPQLPYLKVLAVTGACLLLRKADFEAVNGFDEQFVNGCEDIELCFKLRAAGKRIFLASESRIRHHVSLSRKINTLQDLRNSRHLFSRWRKEIKQELTAVWRRLLAAEPAAYSDHLAGQLSPAFVKTPHSASAIIAETMLRREESYWARELGEGYQHADFAGNVTSWGLQYSRRYGGHVLQSSAEFAVNRLYHTRSFYICGYRIDDLTRPVTLLISANDLQIQTFQLQAERNLNVGIINPILLPRGANVFRVETDWPIVLTHIVIDDQVHSLLP